MAQNYANRLKIPVNPAPEEQEKRFFTPKGLPIAVGYRRVVIGARGPYIECDSNQMRWDSIHIPAGQGWRLGSKQAYYTEYRSSCHAAVKIYHQLKTVDYADYVPGLFYFSPFDVRSGLGEPIIDPLEKQHGEEC